MPLPLKRLAIAGLWAGLACVVGSLTGSLAFALLELLGPSWPPSFELPYAVFVGGLLASAVGFVPLTAMLWGYISMAHRWPAVERDWFAVCAGSIPLAALCWVGSSAVVAGALRGTIVWLPLSGIGSFVLGASFVGLVAARAIVPALSPGALLEPSGALGSLSYFPVSTVLVSSAWLAVGTASTYLFSTELFLPCEDRSLDSCIEAVRSRGFPYPFVQRRFLPFAFL